MSVGSVGGGFQESAWDHEHDVNEAGLLVISVTLKRDYEQSWNSNLQMMQASINHNQPVDLERVSGIIVAMN